MWTRLRRIFDLLRNRNGHSYGSDLEAELVSLALKIAQDAFFKNHAAQPTKAAQTRPESTWALWD